VQAADVPESTNLQQEEASFVRRDPTVRMFGIPLAVTDYSKVLGRVDEWLTGQPGRPLTMDAANTMTLASSCLDERLRRSLLHYDMVLPDGRPLVWFMNRRGAGLSDVVSGPHLGPRILDALRRPTRIALIGGLPDEHRAIADYSKDRFPNAEFVLFEPIPPGPIDEEQVREGVRAIEDTGAELVFVLLGVPRQYYWVGAARSHLGSRVCMSIGGGFNFMTGKYAYAPPWMQRWGLWWLHRALREPRRLIPRYIKYNFLFLWFMLTREILPFGRSKRSRRVAGANRPDRPSGGEV
jgi:N-acetylglucosaminyldiphosphoundecaprenol N-acetyl-beta-D-mannosaminyltransferase